MSFNIGDKVKISEKSQEFPERTGKIIKYTGKGWAEGSNLPMQYRPIWLVLIDETDEEVEIAEQYLESIS